MRPADVPRSTARNARWKYYVIAAGLGLLLLFGGFGYWAAFAGIPYQDPTPEMQARWDFHNRLGRIITESGLAVFALASVGGILDGAWSLVMMDRRSIARNHPD